MITCTLTIKIKDYFPKTDTIPYEDYICLFTFDEYQGQLPFLPDDNEKYTDQLKNINSDIKYKIHVLNFIDMSLIGMCEMTISYDILNQIIPPNGFIQEQQRKLFIDLKTKRKLFGTVVKTGDIFLNIYTEIYLDSKTNIENKQTKRKTSSLHPYVKFDFQSIEKKENPQKNKSDKKILVQSNSARHPISKNKNTQNNHEKLNTHNNLTRISFKKNDLNKNNNLKRVNSTNKNKKIKSVQKKKTKNRNNSEKYLGEERFSYSAKNHINCISGSNHLKNDLKISSVIKNLGNYSIENNDSNYRSNNNTLENQLASEIIKEITLNNYPNKNAKNNNFILISNSTETYSKPKIKNAKLFPNKYVYCSKTKYLRNSDKLKNFDKSNNNMNNINVINGAIFSGVLNNDIVDSDKIILDNGANMRSKFLEQINGSNSLNQEIFKNNCLKLIEFYGLLNKKLSKQISKNKKLARKIFLYKELVNNKNRINHIIVNKENNIDYIFLDSNYTLGNKLLTIYPKTKKIEMQIYQKIFDVFFNEDEVQSFKENQKQLIQNKIYLLLNFIQNVIKQYGNISQIFYDDNNKKTLFKNCLKKYDISEKPENGDCVNLVELFSLKKNTLEKIKNDKFKVIKELKEEDEDENENDGVSHKTFQRDKDIIENDDKICDKENTIDMTNNDNHNKKINEEELIEKKLNVELHDKYKSKYKFTKITPYKYLFNEEEVYVSLSEEGNIIIDYNDSEYNLDQFFKLFEEENNNKEEKEKNDDI